MLDLRLVETKQDQEAVKGFGVSLQSLSENSRRAIYASAYHQYHHARYEDASKSFRLLAILDPFTKEHWMGLGASKQLLKKYEEAKQSYAVASLLDFNDPNPHLHAAECYLSQGEINEAMKALKMAKERCSHNENDQSLKKRISVMEEVWAPQSNRS